MTIVQDIQSLVELNDGKNIIEKGAFSLKYVFEDKEPMQDDIRVCALYMIDIMSVYFEKNYLNQAMHILAVAMYL